MRRVMLMVCCLCGCLLPCVSLSANAITPAEARALSADSEATIVDLNNEIADGYFHQGKFLQSVQVLERIIQLTPEGIEPYADAAWLLWSSGKTAEAIALYQQMLAANPSNANGYMEVGMFYVNRKHEAEALHYLAQAVQLGGLSREQRDLYGVILGRLGHTDDAVAFWRKVLADDQDDPIAQRELKHLTTPPAP